MEKDTIQPEEIVLVQETVSTRQNPYAIAAAIVVAGIIIAGAILLKGNAGGNTGLVTNPISSITLAKVSANDRTLGSPDAKVTLVLYEDFQCPFCGQFHKDVEQKIRDTYVTEGKIQLAYRDFAFLGEDAKDKGLDPEDESLKSAEAARCAGDQGKFWEYHDYLFEHQNGENKRNFSTARLESFAKGLSLDTALFNACLSSSKYGQAVLDAKVEAGNAGVSGTPKGFLITKKDISVKTQNEIIKALSLPLNSRQPVSFYTDKKVMSLDGALPWKMVQPVIDILLKQ